MLLALAHGDTAKEIGSRLSISVGTVHKHLENIYLKLGVPDRLSAVLRAREVGLLREGDLAGEFNWDVRVDFTPPQT
ncbi:LuxR C-terminal-related transcriptional regulator [Leifsonia xyli]|uniref:response regulator transcription factor n=1 Tax=Leifsonia xyli TaxID=1575 RepID=UPI001969A9A5